MRTRRVTMKLEIKNYPLNDIEVGETRRFDHIDCPAGEDTRSRLYLTRPVADPTKVIGYCHNCATSGVHSGTSFEVYRHQAHKNITTTNPHKQVETLIPPEHMESNLGLWTVNARVWAVNNSLTQTDVDRWNIEQDPSTGRVYIPRYSEQGELVGYQLRNVEKNRQSKYLTVTRKDDAGYSAVCDMNLDYDYCVIVEDTVSAIHIYNAFHHAKRNVKTLVNHGTRTNLSLIAAIPPEAEVVVWLDNDSEAVIKAAETYIRTITLVGKNKTVRGELMMSDPKHWCWEDIEEAITGETHG
jgi:hypothetical protein